MVRSAAIDTPLWWAAALLLWAACSSSAGAGGPEFFRHVVVDRKGPAQPWGKGAGDIDGDGRIDLVVGGRERGGLVWYENPGWKRHVISANGEFGTDHEVADIDGDGRADVVSITPLALVWFRNPGWTMATIDRRPLHDIELADLDGDGRVDVVGRNQSAFGGRAGGLHLYFQSAGGTWERRELPAPDGEGLKVADIDGDARPDIAVNGVWLRNPGERNAPWSTHRYTTSFTWPHTSVDVGDIDADGRPDIVLAPSELAGQRFRISWFRAPADPFQEWSEQVIDADVEAAHHFVAIADFDRDGRADIATALMHQSAPPNEVKVYLNLGGGRAWSKRIVAHTGSHNMRVVDVDGDGAPDLFGANWSGEHQPVELWLNQTSISGSRPSKDNCREPPSDRTRSCP